MTLEGRSVLAVVPARGGSKSIPHKNLRQVGGVSLVGRAAQVAKELAWIDASLLSTDDPEIAKEGLRHGLEVPFMRPEALASDDASSIGVWQHAWLAAETYLQQRFDLSVLLEPTSPLRRGEDVERTIRMLIVRGAAAAATVSRTPAHYTPQKTLIVDDAGEIGFYHPEGERFGTRQGIPAYYHRNGLCYAATREHVIDHGRLLEQDAVAVIIDRPVVNIDEPLELELAEWLLNRGS